MTDNFLNIGLGSPERFVTVLDINKKEVTLQSGPSSKVIFKVEDDNGRSFEISDVIVKDRADVKKQGLWLTLDIKGQISSDSALGKLMQYNKVDSLQKLIGTRIPVKNDENNYLVFNTIDEVLKKTSLFDADGE